MYNFSQISGSLNDTLEHKVLIYRSLIKTSLSLLDLASFIIKHDRKNIHAITEVYIYGAADEIKLKKYAVKIKGGKESDFYPPYYEQLLDNLNTIVRRSDCSKDICRFQYEYLFETNFFREQLTLNEFSPSYHDKVITAKIVKDTAVFFANATGLDKKHFASLLSL